jgi:hypothetical protein
MHSKCECSLNDDIKGPYKSAGNVFVVSMQITPETALFLPGGLTYAWSLRYKFVPA